LLAAGGSGGSLVIYDLSQKTPRTVIHEKDSDETALAFSPDGTILAEVGLDPALWDVASGRPILRPDFGWHHAAVAFAPDGKGIALASRKMFLFGRTWVVDLDPGQGTLTLHGLASPISRIAFSKDGSIVAAYSQGWQAAVWDTKSGRIHL